ncbi:MAG: hypothetical protein M1816_001204 [Peltula sp. TS41687]|nr:MAG: hypothetical protein M1816_001204 [Peltula sp. TS41687]
MPAPTEATQREESGMSPALRSAIQGILIFLAAQFAMKQFTGGGGLGGSGGSSAVPAFDEKPHSLETGASHNEIPQQITPIWPSGTSLDISIYVSPTIIMQPLKRVPSERLVAEEKGFQIGDWSDKREIHTSFPLPAEVQNNGTLWGHFYVAVSGGVLDPLDRRYDPSKAFHSVRPLTQYLAKKKVAKTKKLLGGGSSDESKDSEPEVPKQGRTVVSYYHPNFTVSVIPDSGDLNYPTMHPAMRQFVHLESTGQRDASGQNGWYYPILYVNTFWQLRDHMTELNATVKRVPLHVDLNNLKNWKFGMYASIDEGMKQNQRQIASGGPMPAAGDGSELEEVKRILIDTNIWLLTTTGIVSVLHTIFEMLAFKNDISHWKNKKDNVGISVRTIIGNIVMQTIILLYLMDNKEGTSWVILAGQGFGILLEAWKITKIVDVRVRPAPPNSLIPYRITFEDKNKLSDTEQKTKEYDEIAFQYLYMVAIPLLLAYAAYSLVYDSHKSWYSYIIATLVGSVYAYGFLMMVPSLYINYRLKSVAHMPRKAMTYKFLNTFIDDLFAWTIKMPTLHRLATLRDDIVFFIYLYQSYKYKVDYSRINEFGQGGGDDDDDEDLATKQAMKPLTSTPAAIVDDDEKEKKSSASAAAANEGEADIPTPVPATLVSAGDEAGKTQRKRR